MKELDNYRYICFLTIVCEVITRIFCMTAFWEEEVEI